MIRVLIADDHALFRRGLRQTIDDVEGMRVEDEAASGRDVLEKIARTHYHVVILDISMPGINGLETLKQIKAAAPDTAVLILSMHPQEQFAVRAFKAGASGYLTKDVGDAELVQAIRKAHQGGKYVTAAIAEQLAATLGFDFRQAPHEALSDREFEVFRLIAAGKGLSEIAQELRLGVTTVSTYRTRILEKTGLRNNAGITRYAIENRLIDL
jgi:DNA-binding NarL/FixJ family response regulator